MCYIIRQHVRRKLSALLPRVPLEVAVIGITRSLQLTFVPSVEASFSRFARDREHLIMPLY